MELEDWITLVSALIIAIGWFVTGYLGRKNDVALKRLEFRLKALESFLPVWFAIEKNSAPFSDPEFLPLLEETRSKIQLYGHDDEIASVEKFIHEIESQNLAGANAALNQVISLIRRRIREELAIKH